MRRVSLPGLCILLLPAFAASCSNSDNPLAPSPTPTASNVVAGASVAGNPTLGATEGESLEGWVDPDLHAETPSPEPELAPESAETADTGSESAGVAPPEPEAADAVPVVDPPTPDPEPVSTGAPADSDPPASNPPPPPAPASPPPPPPPPPPAEEDPPPAPVPPTGFSLDFEASLAQLDISVTWQAAPAGTYVVEFGSSPGSANLGSFDVSGTTFSYGNLPPGRVYARVRTKISNVVSDPSNEDSVHYFNFKDYIEALFLGTGALVPSDGNHGCTATGVVRGFPAGTTADVIASAATLSAAELAAVQSTTNRVSFATAGAFGASYSETPDADPVPLQNQMTVTIHSSAASQGCPSNAGCALHQWLGGASGGLYHSTRALLSTGHPARATSHEIGHGVIGLCHIDGNRIGGAHLSLMSAGPGVYSGDIAPDLSAFDLVASRAVYQAGIRPGDHRNQLLAAGLINP